MNGLIILIQEFKKMEVLLLKSQGLLHQDIARIVGISGNTVRSYLRDYQVGGIEKLKEIRFYQPQSELNEHAKTIEEYFREHPPATIKEARALIEELTGIQRGLTQIRTFVKSIGMRLLKTGSLPAKADVEEQNAFANAQLEPHLKEARAGKRKVFFVDASHFVFGMFPAMLWCFVRIFVKTPSGRQRYNVLGALDAITHQLITVSNTGYINAESVCELLHQIRKQYKKKLIPLILDNARYQRCGKVQELAAALQMELLFLPPYSPNLNLIERFWKLVKKKCLYSKYYPDFLSFKNTISTFIDNVHVTHTDELHSLLTLNFQDFSKAQVMAE